MTLNQVRYVGLLKYALFLGRLTLELVAGILMTAPWHQDPLATGLDPRAADPSEADYQAQGGGNFRCRQTGDFHELVKGDLARREERAS